MVGTYNSKYPTGEKTYGGYSKFWRGDSNFVFAIPDGVDSAEAAPMMCGGVTLYSPLKQNGCGPGKRVGIVGIGGLGHFGLLFAKALGADRVVAISRTDAKKADALKMGADDFVSFPPSQNQPQTQKNKIHFRLTIHPDCYRRGGLRDQVRQLARPDCQHRLRPRHAPYQIPRSARHRWPIHSSWRS
jgi:D-arabinose 1-dehydrogenase-like Zn-dependent alcohol dehydrogenase